MLRTVSLLAISLGMSYCAAFAATESKPPTASPPKEGCAEFLRRLPNVTAPACAAANLQASAAKSVKGRPLLMRDVQAPDAKLRVLVIGGIHGDELSSTSVAIQWIRLAEAAPSDTPHPVHWRFVPALNPDGLLMQPPRRGNCCRLSLR